MYKLRGNNYPKPPEYIHLKEIDVKNLLVRLNINELEDWYGVSLEDFIQFQEGKLLANFYGYSMVKILTNMYPNEDFNFLSFPIGCESLKYERLFQWISNKLAIHHPGDWIKVNDDDIVRLGIFRPLERFGSLLECLLTIYPEMDWKSHLCANLKDEIFHEIFIEIAMKGQLNCLEDWYLLDEDLFGKFGGKMLTKLMGKGMAICLDEFYPEIRWLPWKFASNQRKFWKDSENVKKYLEWLYCELNMKSLEDWYTLEHSKIIAKGGDYIIHQFKDGLLGALTYTYPNYDWKPWRFLDWEELEHMADMMGSYANQLGIKFPEEWYDWNANHCSDEGVKSILRKFDNSASNLLQTVYPETEWQLWRFQRVSNGFWRDIRNHRDLFQWMGNQLEVGGTLGWYKVTRFQMESFGGDIQRHLSKGEALDILFPSEDSPFKYLGRSRELWDDVELQREFMEWVAKQLGLKNMEDWYNVEIDQISKMGGRALLSCYGYSLASILDKIYPHIKWKRWKFVGNDSMMDVEYLNNLVKRMEKELYVEKLEDWYGVSFSSARKTSCGRELLERYGGSLLELVRHFYPKMNWDESKWNSMLSQKSQHLLFRTIQDKIRTIFPATSVEIEYDAKMKFLGSALELDVWIPKMNLGFEYQGFQHFFTHSFWHGIDGEEMRYMTDGIKTKLARSMDIRLISIPFWENMDANLITNILRESAI
jgi:hypothetical protein